MNAQQLKNSILQMAVQGKLVPQDPNDAPARVLLERIRAEKEELIKQGKIKKEKNPSIIFKGADNIPYEKVGKNEPVSIADEIPFEIPDSWEWVRLNQIFDVEMGQSPKGNTVSETGEGMEFHQGKVFFTERLISVSNQITTAPTKIAQPNSVLLCVRAPVGKVNITDRELCIGRGLCAIKPLAHMSVEFVYHLLETYENIFVKKATGTTFVAITGEVVKQQLIPLPPLKEQERIVTAINNILPHIKNYDVVESALSKLNDSFPNQLKKSILQYAVQGKLVPQDPSDEPADVLLERIREEKKKLIKEGKIKKDKNESIIFRRDNSHYEKRGFEEVCIDAELPFDIPDSWCWARLDNIITVRGGKRLPKGEKLLESPTDHVYIRVTDMKNNSVDLNDLHYIDDKVYREISNYIITKDDIYIVIVGSTIGKVGIIPNELDGMNLTENAARLTPYLVDKEYLLLALQTEYLQRQFLDKTNQVGQPKLALIRLKTSLIPIPPLEEQKRIAQMYKYLLLPVSDL